MNVYNHFRLYFNLVLSIFSSNKLKYFKILNRANKDFNSSKLGISDLRKNNPGMKKSINIYLKKISL